MSARWDRCIYHQGQDTNDFLQNYMAEPHRRALLIAGAGFDPRSTVLAELLCRHGSGRSLGYFLREERPRPDSSLVDRADLHEETMRHHLPGSSVQRLEVFAGDNAVVGGRRAVGLVKDLQLTNVTDVFVDLSALSIGVAFPMVRHLLTRVEKSGQNLHLVVADEPATDAAISALASDVADAVFGFKGRWGLEENSRAARLWMPQLAAGKNAVLERIHQRVQPHAVCPILPFPAVDPRLPDQIMEHFREEFENTWRVDSRDVVYASERGPLDLYRTILRLDDSRRRVFAEIGGSLIVLSPMGSKALAVGALMAALDRDFTIMYVEALGYAADLARLDEDRTSRLPDLVHVWLHGEAYGQPGNREATVP